MTREQFNEAMDIIVGHHTTKVSINLPQNNFVGNMGATEFRLHITECVPSVISELVIAKFMVSMTPNGLLVDKI